MFVALIHLVLSSNIISIDNIIYLIFFFAIIFPFLSFSFFRATPVAHMEVLGLAVKWELQLPDTATATATATWDGAASVNYATA